MHYQLAPHAETKVVRCIRGALCDVILDLRTESKTFGQWYGVELSAENRKMLYVPQGFAHGFITLADDTEAFYFVDESLRAPTPSAASAGTTRSSGSSGRSTPVVLSDKDSQPIRTSTPRYHLGT